MQKPGSNAAPSTKHTSPSLVRAGARANWSRSGHLALLSAGRSHRTRRRVKALAVLASGPQGITNNNNLGQDTKLRMDKFFEVEMAVRDDEVDQYGVVHNANYVVYIHKAREELAASIGFSTASIVCTGNAMAILELNLKYFTPLQRGAKFVVKVRVVQIKGSRILVDQIIETLPDRKVRTQTIDVAGHERGVSFIPCSVEK